MFKVGDVVSSVSPAGVQLADECSTGEESQDYKVVGVLKTGTVCEVQNIDIDYDKWSDPYLCLGVIHTQCVRVETSDGVSGWVSEGAIIHGRKDNKRETDSR